METKAISGGIKDVDQKKSIVTIAIAGIGNLDAVGDIIMPGAFTKTIQEQGPKGKGRIRHFMNHDFNLPLGNPLELAEKDDSLLMVSKVAATTLGRDAMIMYQEGLIKEHSIGYDVKKQEKQKDKEGNVTANLLREISLWEGSSLTGWGANERTPFLGAKELTERMEKLETMLTASGFSDERYRTIEDDIRQIKELVTALAQGFEPPKALDSKGEPQEVGMSLAELLKVIRES